MVWPCSYRTVARASAHKLKYATPLVYCRVFLVTCYRTNIVCVVQLTVFLWPEWSQSRRQSFPAWFGQTLLSLLNTNCRNRLNSWCRLVQRVLARCLHACILCCCLCAYGNTTCSAVVLAFVQLAVH